MPVPGVGVWLEVWATAEAVGGTRRAGGASGVAGSILSPVGFSPSHDGWEPIGTLCFLLVVRFAALDVSDASAPLTPGTASLGTSSAPSRARRRSSHPGSPLLPSSLDQPFYPLLLPLEILEGKGGAAVGEESVPAPWLGQARCMAGRLAARGIERHESVAYSCWIWCGGIVLASSGTSLRETRCVQAVS